MDVRSAARVLVIGQTIADNLFPGMDPVGQTLRVRDLPFRVVGVMVRKGQDPQGRDQDDTAFAPYSAVQKKSWAASVSRLRMYQRFRRNQRLLHKNR